MGTWLLERDLHPRYGYLWVVVGCMSYTDRIQGRQQGGLRGSRVSLRGVLTLS